MSESMIISCTDCTMRESSHCADCVVTFLVDCQPEEAVVIDSQERRAIRMLASAGLVPELRHQSAGGRAAS